MTDESSRKTDSAPPLAPGGCPRCGTRLGQPYKYCPNCAYRLRPDLVPAPPVTVRHATAGDRIIALGGYLLFASMLLLVVFAGVRLFSQPEPPDLVQPQIMRARDADTLPLTPEDFVAVRAGNAFWGIYDPGHEYASGSAPSAAAAGSESAEEAMRALAALRSDAATAEEIAAARDELRFLLDRHESVEEAIRQWAAALDVVPPRDPEWGIPVAYRVDNSFRMSAREVTNDQYFEFLRAWARKSGRPVPPYMLPAAWKRPTGSRDVPRIYDQYEGNLPVVGVPFDAALEFCGWFWEERLDADPNLVVDLPTWREFVLAARGDEITYNFPWGRALHEGESVNLATGAFWSVAREDAVYYEGFLDLVGNAAEWVYWRDIEGLNPVAAGWSCEDAWVYKMYEGELGQPGQLTTPFSADGFRVVLTPSDLRDVGFRLVIREAPQLPSFVEVAAGPVRHGQCPTGLFPPERYRGGEGEEDESGLPQTLEEILELREPLVTFPQPGGQVKRPFEIATSEITNRQYLAFLAGIAREFPPDEVHGLIPASWRRVNRLEPREDSNGRAVFRAYLGYYLPSDHLDVLYPPGEENVPVQGVTIEQAEAYAKWLSARMRRRCAIPSVSQYLRAARGDGTSAYPWGNEPGDLELVSSSRSDFEERAFSLLDLPLTPARRILGLAGNLAEFVRDDGSDGRLLLAGGFFYLPARFCTLDCFLDAGWEYVQYVIQPEDSLPEDLGKLSQPFRLPYHTGFRVVRLFDPF